MRFRRVMVPAVAVVVAISMMLTAGCSGYTRIEPGQFARGSQDGTPYWIKTRDGREYIAKRFIVGDSTIVIDELDVGTTIRADEMPILVPFVEIVGFKPMRPSADKAVLGLLALAGLGLVLWAVSTLPPEGSGGR